MKSKTLIFSDYGNKRVNFLGSLLELYYRHSPDMPIYPDMFKNDPSIGPLEFIIEGNMRLCEKLMDYKSYVVVINGTQNFYNGNLNTLCRIINDPTVMTILLYNYEVETSILNYIDNNKKTSYDKEMLRSFLKESERILSLYESFEWDNVICYENLCGDPLVDFSLWFSNDFIMKNDLEYYHYNRENIKFPNKENLKEDLINISKSTFIPYRQQMYRSDI